MKAIITKKHVALQITNAQAKQLRDALNHHDTPIKYMGVQLYSQGSGWYLGFLSRCDLDNGISDEHLYKLFLRKVRSILYPPVEEVGYNTPNHRIIVKRVVDRRGHKKLVVVDRAKQAAAHKEVALDEDLKHYIKAHVKPTVDPAKLAQLVQRFAH